MGEQEEKIIKEFEKYGIDRETYFEAKPKANAKYIYPKQEETLLKILNVLKRIEEKI